MKEDLVKELIHCERIVLTVQRTPPHRADLGQKRTLNHHRRGEVPAAIRCSLWLVELRVLWSANIALDQCPPSASEADVSPFNCELIYVIADISERNDRSIGAGRSWRIAGHPMPTLPEK
jgi:hypothetical protein